MEINSLSTEPTPHLSQEKVKCGICKNNLKRGASIYQEGLTFGVVCEQCYKKNSQEDLELMANMFLAYGGYFGMLKNSDFSLYNILKQIVSKVENKENVEELHIKCMHQALLNGITPRQFVQGLRILLE